METSNSVLTIIGDFSQDSKNCENESCITPASILSPQISLLDEENPSNSAQNFSQFKEQTSFSDCNSDIILSVYWKRGKLGAAYYTGTDAEVHLLNDIVDVHPDYANLRTLILQVSPSTLVTCGGLQDSFTKTLGEAFSSTKEFFGEISSETEETRSRIIYMSTRNKDLTYDSCKRLVMGLKLGFEPELLLEEEHAVFVSSHIDLSQESMIISLGILMKYLQKYLRQTNLSLELPQISSLSYISIENIVTMDDNTYKALQIFNPKVHPSAFKRNVSGYTREGLSLFAIFNRCKTKSGTKRMREIFMSPSKDLEKINERLDVVEFYLKPQSQHIMESLKACIKKVENVQTILNNICNTRTSVSHWRSLYKSLYNTILIGDICKKYSSHSKLIDKMAVSVTHNVHEVTHYINRVIDFEESISKNQFTVRRGIDTTLDLLKQTYDQIPDILVKVAAIELEDLPSFIEQCSIVYITELGYLLSVPIWKGDGSDESEYTFPNFEVKFIVNNYVHYKTPRCVELDNVLGDSVASISNIESKIMITLIQFIHTRKEDIIKAIKLVAELDCALAFATIASENNYKRPILTLDKQIEIIQGRHPLQELCVHNFVPNDTSFGREDRYLKILTGSTFVIKEFNKKDTLNENTLPRSLGISPNASGKSVYLKQVALISFLAHIGSFVPAESAKICILDHIHSRIQSEESVSTRMSSFLLDLKQMSVCLFNSTPKSLIIIDEFGKGTTEIDGLSLLAGSLIHFIERGQNCPFILASTHFHSLPSLLGNSPFIHLQFMDYIIDNEEICYLYKIRDGVSGESLSLLAAKTVALSNNTIKRCFEIQNGKVPLRCNPKLKITKVMKKEINFMTKILGFISDEDIV